MEPVLPFVSASRIGTILIFLNFRELLKIMPGETISPIPCFLGGDRVGQRGLY
jgi:hypothetical protein